MYAVFATDYQHKTWRVSDPMDYPVALDTWERLDDDRRQGLFPQWKHFEVRAVTVGPDRPLVGPEIRSHDRYDGAPLCLPQTVHGTRGFKRAEDAARRAWRTFTGDGLEQGRGGWFYWPNGRTAAQGLHNLAELCRRKHMIVQGGDGRWYSLVHPAEEGARI